MTGYETTRLYEASCWPALWCQSNQRLTVLPRSNNACARKDTWAVERGGGVLPHRSFANPRGHVPAKVYLMSRAKISHQAPYRLDRVTKQERLAFDHHPVALLSSE